MLSTAILGLALYGGWDAYFESLKPDVMAMLDEHVVRPAAIVYKDAPLAQVTDELAAWSMEPGYGLQSFSRSFSASPEIHHICNMYFIIMLRRCSLL